MILASAVQTPGFSPPGPAKKHRLREKNSGYGKRTPALAENMWNVGHRGVQKYNTNGIIVMF